MSVAVSILIGTLLGILCANLLVKQIIKSKWILQLNYDSSSVAKKLIWVIAYITFPLAWFLGFIFGGNFGGAVAAYVATGFPLLEKIIIPAGIAIGIFVCTVFFAGCFSFLGSIVFRFITRK